MTQGTVPRMSLANVKAGFIDRTPLLGVYGMPGVGKTTFAASAPNVVFLGAERGTEHLDVPRFPVPQTWEQVHDAVTVLLKEKHAYKTLAFDSLDWAEALCWASVCADWGVRSIEKAGPNGGGFGKGYGEALEKWRYLLKRFELLRDQAHGGEGMNVILIAHSHVKPFRNPAGADYMRYTMKLQDKATELVKEAVGILLFAMFEERVSYVSASDQPGQGPQGRIMSDAVKRRVLRTEYGAAWDAKSRPAIEDPLPFRQDTGWADVMAARKAKLDPKALESRAVMLAAELGPLVDQKTRDAIAKTIEQGQGNAGRLEAVIGRLVDRLRAEREKEQVSSVETEGGG